MKVKSIAVFCASSLGLDNVWAKEARYVGTYLAGRSITVVYGGGRVGLMGELANGALDNNGKVIGVIPSFLNSKEREHSGVTQLIVVQTMHERKLKMSELCDGIIAMPGGFGTLDELFEMITWGQLGLHQKPVGLLNINGFYDHLITFIKEMVKVGFLKRENHEMLLVANTIDELVQKMENYQAPPIPKWLNIEQS